MKTSKSTPKMDPNIWSKLPQDLLDNILCFLPLHIIFNLRSTSKHFKSLLFNPSFISHFSPSSFSSFILLSHPNFITHFPLYDTVLSSWHHKFSSVSRSIPNPCTPSSSSSLLSSSNGLLCFHNPSSSSFLVSNLLSLSSSLVKFPKLPFLFELITLISCPSGFKIFTYSSNTAFLYDSRVNSWTHFHGSGPWLNHSLHQQGVHQNGILYFTKSDPFSILGFDIESGYWFNTFHVLPLGEPEIVFGRIVAGGQGKMYMVGGVGRNGISKCLKLWVLKRMEGNECYWDEIQILPDLMYKKLVSVCYHNYEHVYCFWHQGLVCICCYTWPEILYYKVARRTWHWLPKCPSLPHKWSCGFRWFSFVPTLSASV